ncbi:hypothetical protein [Legionella worsleiensis]|uniref:Coiled coil domain-containing protein n=1 Tax=Legionella worsleiensis TaxID=45076 RepID=A0A0W1AIN8_9GAMM|nr:hypothetical protein [Legionella worsleiensis]KTD81195.1 coiled coil domain-containing protein [Legionella worsleiensis]STY33171.1 coiled coil domain protein [Legionella worsleiensis]
MPGPLLTRIPLIGKHLFSNEYINQLTPKAIEDLGKTYRNIIGLGNNPSFADQAFNTLDSQRTESNAVTLIKSKDLYGSSIFDKMDDRKNKEASEAAKAIKNTLTNQLKTEPAYTKALKKYNDQITFFKELVKKIPNEKFGAEALLSTYKYYIDKARAAIMAQQDLDKNHLEQQFDSEEFKANLQTVYGIKKDDADADQRLAHIKTTMINDLVNAQKTQLAEFDKSTSASINKLHQASAEEYRQMGLIETLKRAHNDNVAMLEHLAEKNRKKNEENEEKVNVPSVALANVDETGAKIKMTNVKLGDIQSFKSMTGMEIKQEQPGVFKFQFDVLSPRYYQSLAQKPLTDFLLISQLIKTQGNDKINWTIDIKDPKTLMERARQAIEGSVRAGFALDKIKICDKSGRELKLEEIFKDHSEAFSRVQNRAAEIQQELATLKAPEIKSAKNSYAKEAIQALKNKNNPPPQPQPGDNPNPAPTV